MALYLHEILNSNGMATKEEVASFLNTFVIKSKTLGMIFRGDRAKNIQTLAELEMTATQREEEVLSLRLEHYSEGPLPDTLNNIADMWVFGKRIKKQEIYIKISSGCPNDKPWCISFHVAKNKMNYPFSEINNIK